MFLFYMQERKVDSDKVNQSSLELLRCERRKLGSTKYGSLLERRDQ